MNAETKHTPGDWVKSGPQIRANGYNIASVNSHKTSEGQANQNLMCSAPELLDALEAIINGCDSGEECIDRDRYNKARAAIAQAKEGKG